MKPTTDTRLTQPQTCPTYGGHLNPDEATFQANRGLIYTRNSNYDTDGGQYYVRVETKF
jgi:hypothetical protein